MPTDKQPDFLTAIRKAPDDDAPRLACADWLDEHGESDRAAFIRLQCQMHRMPQRGLKFTRVRDQTDKLLKKHEKEWVGPLARWVRRYDFRRGFIESVRLEVAAFLKHAEQLFQLVPLRALDFVEPKDLMPALVRSPFLGRVESLRFHGFFIVDQFQDDNRLSLLLASPQLRTVRRLDLGTNGLDTADTEQVARCKYLKDLNHLDLTFNSIGDAGLRAVAYSDCLTSLNSLVIFGYHQVGPKGVQALVGSPGRAPGVPATWESKPRR
jgi:uncharacterized protein (TIGR02996 family)